MTVAIIILVIAAALIAVAVARSIHVRNAEVPESASPSHASMSSDDIARLLLDDGSIVCRPGYIHYDLSRIYVDKTPETPKPFAGYAYPDSQHDAAIVITDCNHNILGRVDAQPKLYEHLIANGRTRAYGVIRSDDNNRSIGECCIAK